LNAQCEQRTKRDQCNDGPDQMADAVKFFSVVHVLRQALWVMAYLRDIPRGAGREAK